MPKILQTHGNALLAAAFAVAATLEVHRSHASCISSISATAHRP
jgi:hypothetical protein